MPDYTGANSFLTITLRDQSPDAVGVKRIYLDLVVTDKTFQQEDDFRIYGKNLLSLDPKDYSSLLTKFQQKIGQCKLLLKTKSRSQKCGKELIGTINSPLISLAGALMSLKEVERIEVIHIMKHVRWNIILEKKAGTQIVTECNQTDLMKV